ncbi:hypothetical protein [Microbulbifer discodermiae]|uniref:hypothetical protein n=1 Tax=Microbulbifer sp. 2201CG32-9 TaxID=3232309 RepID=UPI00345BD9E4
MRFVFSLIISFVTFSASAKFENNRLLPNISIEGGRESSYDFLQNNFPENKLEDLTVLDINFLKTLAYDEFVKLGDHNIVPIKNIIQPYVNYYSLLEAYQNSYQDYQFKTIEGCSFSFENFPKGEFPIDLNESQESKLNGYIPDCVSEAIKSIDAREVVYLLSYEIESAEVRNKIRIFNKATESYFERNIELSERDTGNGFAYDTSLIAVPGKCAGNNSCTIPAIYIDNYTASNKISFRLEGKFEISRTASYSDALNSANNSAYKVKTPFPVNFVNGEFNSDAADWSGGISFGGSCFNAPDISLPEAENFFLGLGFGSPPPAGFLLGNAVAPIGDRLADVADLSQTISVPSNVDSLNFFLRFQGGTGKPISFYQPGTTNFTITAIDQTAGNAIELANIVNIPNGIITGDVSIPLEDLGIAGHTVNFRFRLCDFQDSIAFPINYDYNKGRAYIDDVTLTRAC